MRTMSQGSPLSRTLCPKRVTTPATGCKSTCLASLLEVKTPHTISKTKPATLKRGRTQPQLHLQRGGASSTNVLLKPLYHQHKVWVQGQCTPDVDWKLLSFNATCTVLGPKKVRPVMKGPNLGGLVVLLFHDGLGFKPYTVVTS